MVKKTGSRVIKVVAVAAVMLTLMTNSVTSAMAGVSQNFEFVFAKNGSWQLTGVLSKTNPSYVSMKCLYAEIEGSCYDAVVVAMPSQAQSCPRPYRFYQGTYELIPNTVYEDGARLARIDAWCVNDVYGQGAIFSGYWYADSDIY